MCGGYNGFSGCTVQPLNPDSEREMKSKKPIMTFLRLEVAPRVRDQVRRAAALAGQRSMASWVRVVVEREAVAELARHGLTAAK